MVPCMKKNDNYIKPKYHLVLILKHKYMFYTTINIETILNLIILATVNKIVKIIKLLNLQIFLMVDEIYSNLWNYAKYYSPLT